MNAPAPPFVLHAPDVQTAPVVFASAHSGRHYTPAFLASARLDPLALRRSEDSFVEQLFGAAPERGAPLLEATYPRAYCDLNREKWELDPAMFDGELPPWVNSGSARVQAGLGTLARVVASGEAIYRDKLSFAEAEARVQACWTPFHAALRRLIDETLARFGACLLIDCHSMPSLNADRRQADFVLGDAHGTSCAEAATARVEAVLRGFGYTVARNEPYAGGHITRHYGQPGVGVHALQIEIGRRLYMDEQRIEPNAGFATLQGHLAALIEAVLREARSLLGGRAAT